MTTDHDFPSDSPHHDRHAPDRDDRFDPFDPFDHHGSYAPYDHDRIDDAWSMPGGTGSHGERDFWGDQDEWVTPVRAEPDDTTHTMRRPQGLFGAVGAWADRALSSGVEPTRSHGVVRAGGDDVPPRPEVTPLLRRRPAHVDRHPSDPAAGAPVRDLPGDDEAVHHDDTRWHDAEQERWDDGWDIAPAAPVRGGVDPLLVRLGGLAVVLTLLVPFLLGMRSDGDDDQLRDAGAVTADTDTVTTAPTPSTAPDVTSGPATEASTGVAEVEATTAAPATSASTEPAASDGEATSDAPIARSSALGDGDGTTAVPPVTEPAQADEPADRVCAAQYDVVAGDFWLRLADAAGVDLDDLLAVNDATIDTALFPGRTICLPAGARTPAPPTTEAPSPAPTTAAPTTAAPSTAAPSTAAPTTAAPSPSPAPVAPGDVEQIIRAVWPDELEDRALEIAWRESNYVPTAKNFCCYGLFQIYWEVHRSWLADLGVTSAEQLYDPTTNARAALRLYERSGGWGPWGF